MNMQALLSADSADDIQGEANIEYWDSFYTKNNQLQEPSPFAQWCVQNYFDSDSKVLDLGCGNGRDTFYFLKNKIVATGADGSSHVIGVNNTRLGLTGVEQSTTFFELHFGESEVKELPANLPEDINVIYSRFFLHAISEADEDRVLDFCDSSLQEGGKLCFEFRTTHDPLMSQGIRLSANERYTDHYRRFIDSTSFRKKIKKRGWDELYFIESKNLAIWGNENPVVARIILSKSTL
jgi:ubiquinone/menaquinone biosynthesis C-methylase UbiE